MYFIYVGDSKDVYSRLKTNHCNGNVEASALRRYVAEAMGFKIKFEKRPSGSTRARVDLPTPKQGEKAVSDYIRQGKWQILILDNYIIAHDFQWYVIEKLKPLLNRESQNYQIDKSELYENLFERLTKSALFDCNGINESFSGPGIYVLYHEQKPKLML